MSFGISFNVEIGIVVCVTGKIFYMFLKSELLDIDDEIGDGEGDG